MQGNMGYQGPTGLAQGLKGTGYKQVTAQNFTPEQMNLFQRMFSQIAPESYTSRLASGDQSTFDQMEAPALRQFGALQGNLASRFSGMGIGARRSSDFQNQMTLAASSFAQDLAARRQELQRQAMLDLFGMQESMLGQRPYEQFFLPKQEKPNFLRQLLGGIGSIAGDVGTRGLYKQLGIF